MPGSPAPHRKRESNGKGPGTDLERGKTLFAEHCAECHGNNGEGSNDDVAPRIQAQHFNYLERQFNWISEGKRRNVSGKMDFIKKLTDSELAAVLDYTSRLMPPEELRAPEGWRNPDFE